MSAVDAGNLGRDIVRHRLAGRQGGLRLVQVPPANEGAAVSPSRAGCRRETESHDDLDRSKSVHLLLMIPSVCWLRFRGSYSASPESDAPPGRSIWIDQLELHRCNPEQGDH